MEKYVALALGGIPIGAMYALQALGIVLVYKTTRVFTFATGAVGLASAYLASTLVGHGVPRAPALLLAVGLGIVIGLAMEVSTRPVQGTLSRTVVTLGWLLALQGIVGAVYGIQEGSQQPARIFSSARALTIGPKSFGWDQLAVIVITVALVAGLAWFFRATSLGTATRAVSETPEAARLLGISVNRVNLVAWGISGATSGLAGVLISPLLNKLDTTTLVVFTVQALAAALLGQLTSLPRTLIGGLALGMAQPMVGRAVTLHLEPVRGLDEVTALLVVLVSLLLFRRSGRRDQTGGGIVPAAVTPLPTGRTAAAWAAGILGAAVVVPLVLGSTGKLSTNNLAQTAVWGLAVLSLVLLVGVVGQVSVCQGVFMGVGAFGTGIGLAHGVPFLLAVPLGAALAAVVAAVVGLPAVRLEPLELAIATLSLAFTADRFLYSWRPFATASGHRDVTRPGFANLDPGHAAVGQRNYAWLALFVFLVACFAVASLRRGRTGAALTALRSSEPATAAMGFSVASVKLRGFAASGFVAGLAGGLYAGLLEGASGAPFDFTRSITLLAYTVIVGVASVPGAFLGGLVVTASLLTFGSTGEVASGTAESVSTLVTGVLLIGVLAFAPGGLTAAASRGVDGFRARAA